jgi:DNA-binding LacI/PurR family transcriptional regulator
MPENDADTVRCDSISAARSLTEQMLGLGHARVAMLSGPEAIVTARERAFGYSEAMLAAGLTPDVHFGNFSPESGYRMATDLLAQENRPTAFITANNFIALGAARAAADLGVPVPEALSISTFDSLSTDIVLEPFFTGVVQPVERLGSLATSMLLERVLGVYSGPGRAVILPTSIEVHLSTGPVPA